MAYGEIMRARIAVHARIAFNNAAKARARGAEGLAIQYDTEGEEYARCARFWATWDGDTTKLIRLRAYIMAQRPRSAWDKGVKEYALDMLDNVDWYEMSCQFCEYSTWESLKRRLLNGADDWREYSWAGCSLCYDVDICRRLATASEQRRKRGGVVPPNKEEAWLDVQARALAQAEYLIKEAWFNTPDSKWGWP